MVSKTWEERSTRAVAVLERLNGPALCPYRSLWAYPGSAWSALSAADGAVGAADRATQLDKVRKLTESRDCSPADAK